MEETLKELLTKLEHEWAPDLLNIGAAMIFYNSLGWLIVGFVALILTIVGTIYATKLIRIDLARTDTSDISGYGMGGLFIGTCSIVSFLFSALILLNIWNWVGIFDPKIALAKRIFEAAIGKPL